MEQILNLLNLFLLKNQVLTDIVPEKGSPEHSG